MNSEEYWRDRAVNLIYDYMTDSEAIADEIHTLYSKASIWLSYNARKIFNKYKRKHHLSEAEARRLISQIQDSTSLDDLKAKLEEEGRNPELIAELEAPAYQFRIDRLRQIQNQLDIVMDNVYKQEKTVMTNFFVDLANDSYYRTIFNVQKRTGLAFGFAKVDPKQIDKVVSMKWSGKHFSERLWRNAKSLTKTIKEELLLNLVTGRTESEAAKILANKFNQGFFEARRLIRTESAFVHNELNAAAYEECDLEKYQYLATLDLRTSEICRELDGKVFLFKDRQVGKNFPPMHPWCRSTTIAIIDEEDIKNLQRRAFNPETERYEMVPASMNYEEWYKKYVKGNALAEAQEKAIKNKASDKEQYRKYKESGVEGVPNSFVGFQKMKYQDPDQWENLKKSYRERGKQS